MYAFIIVHKQVQTRLRKQHTESANAKNFLGQGGGKALKNYAVLLEMQFVPISLLLVEKCVALHLLTFL